MLIGTSSSDVTKWMISRQPLTPPPIQMSQCPQLYRHIWTYNQIKMNGLISR